MSASPRVTAVIPAHNEEAVVGRLLTALSTGPGSENLDVIVVCNGCTDDTAGRVQRDFPAVRLAEIPEASKQRALSVGDTLAADAFPRAYIDADVLIDAADVVRLAAAISGPGPQAAAPARILMTASSGTVVRAYYRVWSQLSPVRQGLYGRGVIVVNAAAHALIRQAPELLGDDLTAHHAVPDDGRHIIESAHSQVWVPRTISDLLRRRVRAAYGNSQAAATLDHQSDTTSASVRDLASIARRSPTDFASVAVFTAVTLTARARALWMSTRSGSTVTWLRDESSRGQDSE